MTEYAESQPMELDPLAFYWFDFGVDGNPVGRPAQWIDGKLVFLDRPTKNA